MSAGSRLWTALEAAPGLRAVPAVWKQRLGNDYVAASRFLRPDGNRASAHPCTAPQACGCAHEIIEHAPDDVVSVCRCEPRRCDVRALTPTDILLHEVNRRELCDAVAVALGAAPAWAAVPRLHATWAIGRCGPSPGPQFPVFMTVQVEPDELRGVCDALVAQLGAPFVLVAPTRDLLTPACEEPLRRVRAHFLALADDFTLSAEGAITTHRAGIEILEPFLAAVLPTPKGTGSQGWGGRHLTAKEAAKQLGYSTGAALRKAVDRAPEEDSLHILHQGGPARTRGGRFYEDAVAHVAGMLAGAGEQYVAGVAKRKEAARAARAATPPADPRAAERRLLQALARKEKQSG